MVDEERVIIRHDTTPSYAHGDVVEEHVRRYPSGAEVARRVVVFIFGLIQILLLLRIALLLIGANSDHALVAGLYDLSALFVAPFEGILGLDRAREGASVLDVAAVVALVGWTILEVIILAALSIARRER